MLSFAHSWRNFFISSLAISCEEKSSDSDRFFHCVTICSRIWRCLSLSLLLRDDITSVPPSERLFTYEVDDDDDDDYKGQNNDTYILRIPSMLCKAGLSRRAGFLKRANLNKRFSRDLIAAMLVDENKRSLISFSCSSSRSLVFPFQTTWCYSREQFLSNVVLRARVRMHSLWTNKRKTPLRTSRGLKWENKTYKLRRSIQSHLRLNFFPLRLQYLEESHWKLRLVFTFVLSK